MSNAIICIEKRFAVKNSGISCVALMLNLSNLKMKIQHRSKKLVQGCEIQWPIYSFLYILIQAYDLVVKASSRNSGDGFGGDHPVILSMWGAMYSGVGWSSSQTPNCTAYRLHRSTEVEVLEELEGTRVRSSGTGAVGGQLPDKLMIGSKFKSSWELKFSSAPLLFCVALSHWQSLPVSAWTLALSCCFAECAL